MSQISHEDDPIQCDYIVSVWQADGTDGRALARNEIENILRDVVERNPHYAEQYGEISIEVEEAG